MDTTTLLDAALRRARQELCLEDRHAGFTACMQRVLQRDPDSFLSGQAAAQRLEQLPSARLQLLLERRVCSCIAAFNVARYRPELLQ